MISKTAPLFAYNYDFSERYKLNISLCNLCYNSLAMEFYKKNLEVKIIMKLQIRKPFQNVKMVSGQTRKW